MISVVIPTHNRPNLLKRAIESVIRQTYKEVEIIVVDDASSCNNESIINNFTIPIIYYRFENKQGGNACRNKGAELASGEYIAFLDDDDEFLPEKIEKQIAFMRNTNIDMTYTAKNIIKINNQNEIVNKKYSFYHPKNGNLKKEIMKKNFIGTTSSIMVNKEKFFLTGGFDINMPALQDYEFYIRFIYKNFKVKGINDSLVNYFIDQKNDTVSKNFKKRLYATKYIILKNKNQKYFHWLLLSRTKSILIHCMKLITAEFK